MMKLRLEPRHSGSRIPALNPSSSSSFCSAFFLRKWVELIVLNVTVDDWVRILVQVIAAQGYVTGPFLESSMGFLPCSVNEDGTHPWACTPVLVPGKACTPVVGLHCISIDPFWCWDSPFLKILGTRRYIFSSSWHPLQGLQLWCPCSLLYLFMGSEGVCFGSKLKEGLSHVHLGLTQGFRHCCVVIFCLFLEKNLIAKTWGCLPRPFSHSKESKLFPFQNESYYSNTSHIKSTSYVCWWFMCYIHLFLLGG